MSMKWAPRVQLTQAKSEAMRSIRGAHARQREEWRRGFEWQLRLGDVIQRTREAPRSRGAAGMRGLSTWPPADGDDPHGQRLEGTSARMLGVSERAEMPSIWLGISVRAANEPWSSRPPSPRCGKRRKHEKRGRVCKNYGSSIQSTRRQARLQRRLPRCALGLVLWRDVHQQCRSCSWERQNRVPSSRHCVASPSDQRVRETKILPSPPSQQSSR